MTLSAVQNLNINIMKNQAKLTIGNETTYLTLQVNTNKSKTFVRKELLTKFIAWYDTMRFVGASTFKANKPLDVKYTIDNKVIFDTKGDYSHLGCKELIAEGVCKLKIQNTPQGRVRFEQRLEALLNLVLMLSEVESETKLSERKETINAMRIEYGMN